MIISSYYTHRATSIYLLIYYFVYKYLFNGFTLKALEYVDYRGFTKTIFLNPNPSYLLRLVSKIKVRLE
ncbi:hypothetical protein BH09DEP1_BH09DEP1_6970 [soil metagenome]